MPQEQSVFTSRPPRNPQEIDTCLAMLEDSPFWDSAYDTMDRHDAVKAWVGLLRAGRGYIDILQNDAYAARLNNHREHKGHTRFDHAFVSVTFVNYISYEFAREIVTKDDIRDIHLHFLQSVIRHGADGSLPSPAMTAEQIELGQNQVPGHGLYLLVSMIRHPAFDRGTAIAASPQLMERLRRTPLQICGGLLFHAWITNVTSELSMRAYTQFGNSLLREYPGNDARTAGEKKFVFCLTKNLEVSEALGVPAHVGANIDDERFIGNWYKIFFDNRRPSAGLNKNEQHTCFLITLGYTSVQIAKALSTTTGCINQYQNKAGAKLYDAGYRDVASRFHEDGHSPKYNRETISKVVSDNLHEVRSYILPLYPCPDYVYLR